MAVDLLSAVNRFILQYADPAIPQERVYRGYQNRIAVMAAADGEEYCVYAVSDTKRIGSNVTAYAAGDTISTKSMREYVVEIDFCSGDEAIARQRAEGIETLARSFIAVDFFKKHGFGLLFADDIKPLPYVLDTDQFAYRYRVALHITGWISAAAAQDYFDKIEVGPNPVIGHKGFYFENVDVYHLPKIKE